MEGIMGNRGRKRTRKKRNGEKQKKAGEKRRKKLDLKKE